MRTILVFVWLLIAVTVHAQSGFSLFENKKNKRIEVRFNQKLITAYYYGDSVDKPILFPIKTLGGTVITRGYPMAPRAGDRIDQPHEVGLWLSHQDVNGLDFWNSVSGMPADRRKTSGSIRFQNVLTQSADAGKASFRTHCHWLDINGKVLVEEVEEFTFREHAGNLIIDRSSVLKANGLDIRFMDANGLLGLRLSRELEPPAKEEVQVLDMKGNLVKGANNVPTGTYTNKEGLPTDGVSGKKSLWVAVHGRMEGQDISVVVIDHPMNVGSPAYWQVGGGLIAANPLGKKLFTQGKQQLNFKLMKDQSSTFRYRIVVHGSSSALTTTEIEAYREEFAAIR
ncbi:MAG TPA: PmoA family protein [Cyclobacteriaceae bacterium]|nr:PmoA family protein [Cyclobacteriaceae bacterium]